MRSSVDLPLPFGPTTPTRSPSASVSEKIGEERRRPVRLADALDGEDDRRGHGFGPRERGRRRRAPPTSASFSLRLSVLIQCSVLERVAPRAHAPRPQELDRQTRARVARRASRRVLLEAARQILGGAGVERTVACSAGCRRRASRRRPRGRDGCRRARTPPSPRSRRRAEW